MPVSTVMVSAIVTVMVNSLKELASRVLVSYKFKYIIQRLIVGDFQVTQEHSVQKKHIKKQQQKIG